MYEFIIFREENQLADFIPNTTTDKEEKHQFHNFIQLPSMGRQILNIDKNQIPPVRIKTRIIDNNINK